MSLEILKGAIPPGGYHFPDRSGGSEVRIDGYSIEDVAGNVLKFRLQNNRDPGNPMQEVQEYICSSWPHFCRDIAPAKVAHARLPEPLSRRCASMIGAWFASVADDPGVTQAEANRRAAICALCPTNKNHENGGCGACTSQVQRLSFIYRHNRSTAQDSALKCCDILSTPLQAAVWSAKLPPFTEEQRGALPNNCWRH